MNLRAFHTSVKQPSGCAVCMAAGAQDEPPESAGATPATQRGSWMGGRKIGMAARNHQLHFGVNKRRCQLTSVSQGG